MKVQEIINGENGEQAVMSIDELLNSIYLNKREDLSKEELNFCLIEELEREVNSGGFNSFFYNDYGNYAKETIIALDEIGSVMFKSILEQAVSVFGKYYNAEEISRVDNIIKNEDKYDEIWETLDSKFYEYEENIHDLLLAYVVKNIEKFR